jgi:hypothetical protein
MTEKEEVVGYKEVAWEGNGEELLGRAEQVAKGKVNLNWPLAGRRELALRLS